MLHRTLCFGANAAALRPLPPTAAAAEITPAAAARRAARAARATRDARLGAALCGVALCNQHTSVLLAAPLIVWVLAALAPRLVGANSRRSGATSTTAADGGGEER